MIFQLKTKILIGFLISVVLITAGLGCKCTSKEMAEKIKPINLVYWRPQDGQDAFSAILQSFRALYPHISITYQQIRPEEYEQALLEAWAEDQGPDIFAIPNTWLGKYQTKILPLSLLDELTIGRQITTGTIKKEQKIIEEKKKAPSLRDLRETFVETISKDLVIDDKIYGLPLSLDILSLYYNQDILNSAGIIEAPKNWQDFVNDVHTITIQDNQGDFLRSGAAMGSSKNVENLTDILSLLMMQNGTAMADYTRGAIFNQPLIDDPNYFPGKEALKFYTSFADPYQEIYTWHDQMPNSLESFIQGKVAFIFGYSDYLSLIKQQAPKLNFDIAPVPQISASLKEINYARYWLETISKKTQHPQEAWVFLLYATQAQNAQTFIERTKKPTAHRALIEKQLEDFDLAPFVKGVLTAQTWYRGKNYSLVEESFRQMVAEVFSGEKTIDKAINYCVQKINLTY
ncbi:MAG: extracellular solute-binding protein [Patescibacteria group bacterium]|jgi:ABC-type glycerol-3-phosphate transport system substrate-binding protein|nr:extracellular solute-binding protein [Patescibacteria group bacterium]